MHYTVALHIESTSIVHCLRYPFVILQQQSNVAQPEIVGIAGQEPLNRRFDWSDR